MRCSKALRESFPVSAGVSANGRTLYQGPLSSARSFVGASCATIRYPMTMPAQRVERRSRPVGMTVSTCRSRGGRIRAELQALRGGNSIRVVDAPLDGNLVEDRQACREMSSSPRLGTRVGFPQFLRQGTVRGGPSTARSERRSRRGARGKRSAATLRQVAVMKRVRGVRDRSVRRREREPGGAVAGARGKLGDKPISYIDGGRFERQSRAGEARDAGRRALG